MGQLNAPHPFPDNINTEAIHEYVEVILVVVVAIKQNDVLFRPKHNNIRSIFLVAIKIIVLLHWSNWLSTADIVVL